MWFNILCSPPTARMSDAPAGRWSELECRDSATAPDASPCSSRSRPFSLSVLPPATGCIPGYPGQHHHKDLPLRIKFGKSQASSFMPKKKQKTMKMIVLHQLVLLLYDITMYNKLIKFMCKE